MAHKVFGWSPSFGGGVEQVPRLRAVAFGDGYGQAAPDGLNHQPRTLSLTFAGRSDAEASAILAFLREHGGAEWFHYTHPGEPAGKFRAPSWSAQDVDKGARTVAATFVECFDPGE